MTSETTHSGSLPTQPSGDHELVRDEAVDAVEAADLDVDLPATDLADDEPPAAGGFDLTPQDGGRSRRRLGVVAGILVAVLLIGGVAWWRAAQSAPAPAPVPVAAAQHSLFIAVATPDDHLVNGLYYATGDAPTGLFTPGTLFADVPTLGPAPLSDTLPVGTDVPGTVFSDVTGLEVGQSWALPMDAMVTLIDKAGGVTIDVDVPVAANEVDLAVGDQQTLNGHQALTFATWTATGEAQSSQVARMSQVATTLIAELPDDRGEIEAWLGEVPGSTTASTADLAERLVELRAAVTSEEYVGALLPTTPAGTPNVPDGVALDRDRLSTLLAGRIDDLRLFEPGSAGSVVLQNASGVASLDLSARRALIDAGYDYEYGGAADPVQPVTIVMVPPDGDSATGRAIATVLGVPGAQVVTSPLTPADADALILIGTDVAEAHSDEAEADDASGGTSSGSSGAPSTDD